MFRSERIVRGETTENFTEPNWQPLLELAPEHIDDFMWMGEIELESGLKLHGYKHRETREYLHLDTEGRAFIYIWDESRPVEEPGCYREVDPHWILHLVLRRRSE